MNNIDCNVIKDLLPLYFDDLVSEETKIIIDEHLKKCNECSSHIDKIYENIDIDEKLKLDIDNNKLDKNGEKIVLKIKKSQDRIKYTFIIFAMTVGVSNTWLSKGFMSTIPLIIIVPFILNLLFEEKKIILLTAICSNIILSLATDNLDLGLIATPLLIVAVLSGTLLGSTVTAMREGK